VSTLTPTPEGGAPLSLIFDQLDVVLDDSTIADSDWGAVDVIYTGSDDYWTNVLQPHQAERAIRIGLDLHRAARIGVHGVDPWLDGARVIDLGFGCEERQLESNRLGARIQRQERCQPRQQCHAKSRHPRLPLMLRLA
jgi:hypothetical protein